MSPDESSGEVEGPITCHNHSLIKGNDMGRIVIVGYKPKPGKSAELIALMETHLPTLRREGLVTNRESILMVAKDGTVIEVFEWQSKEAIEKAHSNPAVLKMWDQYAKVCDYVPIGKVEEVENLFSEFTPLEDVPH